MPKKAGKSTDFETALKELEIRIAELEEGNLSLDESIQSFEKSIKIIQSCQATLNQAERKIQILIKKNNTTSLKKISPEELD